MYKNAPVLLLAILVSSHLVQAQSTKIYNDPDADFKTAKELAFDKSRR